jgi:hypothetical protein
MVCELPYFIDEGKQNDVTSMMSADCEPDHVTATGEAVICPCCTYCCYQQEFCNNNTHVESLDGIWETQYSRNSYQFGNATFHM